MFLPIHTLLPMAKEKQVRILALGGQQRTAAAPDVPTLQEQGFQGFDVALWYGLLAPAGTPAEITSRYNQAINEILNTPDVKQTLAQQGLTPVGGTADRLAQLIEQDLKRWASVVRDAGLTQQ
jgi:tripartite-type tricarboxylate transporter receptor subunit TctC